MSQVLLKIGPHDAGRRLSVDEFDACETETGYLYELSRGVVSVTEVPKPAHMFLVQAILEQLLAYKSRRKIRDFHFGTGSECKLIIPSHQSERHPDLAVYLTLPPTQNRGVWKRWIPELVIEVVSPGSEQRDYIEKREEYLDAGISEYWIVNSKTRQLLVLERVDNLWRESTFSPPMSYRSQLLADFELDLNLVFESAS